MNKENKQALLLGGLLMAIGIVLGAFGAHGLKPHLTVAQLDSYQTAIHYHQLHALGIICIGILSHMFGWKTARHIWITMALGILLFSGSIYLLSCRDILGIENTAFLGPATPIGGLLLIISWLLLCRKIYKS